MSAGPNAKPIGEKGKWTDGKGNLMPMEKVKEFRFKCNECGNTGNVTELLEEDNESTVWCPLCGTASWEWI